MIICLGSLEPFKSKTLYTMEMLNEVFSLFLLYHQTSLTEFLSDVDVRSRVGYSMICFTSLNIIINFSLIFGQNIEKLISKFRIVYLKALLKFKYRQKQRKQQQ